jgi:CrcB protein
MLSYIWVGLGGAVGRLARYWASGVVARRLGETFPWGTLVVNVTGSFAIGCYVTATGSGRSVAGGPGRPSVCYAGHRRRLHDVFLLQSSDPQLGA